MLCILCLTPPPISINIFDLEGRSLNVGGVITKHFWLQPREDKPNARIICTTCWNALNDFHEFYQKVEESHEVLTATGDSLDNKVEGDSSLLKVEPHLDVEVDYDALPCPIEPKFAKQPSFNRLNNPQEDANIEATSDTKFEPDVVMETAIDPLEEIKVKEEILQEINSDSESEIPLSRLSNQEKSDKQTKPRTSRTNDVKWEITSYHDEVEKPMGSQDLGEIINQNIDLSCYLCEKKFSDFFLYRDHFQKAHNEPGYVACCDKKFTVRRNLVDHILLHKYPDYFKCDKCPKVLACRKNLKEHMRIHDRKYIFSCEKCNKVFDRKLMLERHMDIHVEERTFKCDQCDKLFASKFSLGQHIYGIHKGGYTKVCEQCGKVTRDKEAFVRHQLEHTGAPKPFVKCEQCGTKLANKNGLRKHIQEMHPNTGITHVCKVCGTTASNIIALRRHITFMHKYERSHKCPMCDKAFKRALTLKEHMSTHTGEVLYTCPHCPKTFNSNANMHSHRKKMHRKEWEENRRYQHAVTAANTD